MARIIDKAIALACCALTLVVSPWGGEVVVALLLAIAASALCEIAEDARGAWAAFAYAVAAMAFSSFAPFLPLAAYDLSRASSPWVRVAWVAPLAAALARCLPGSETFAAALTTACAVAFLLGWRSVRVERAREHDRQRRDSLRQDALAIESKYAELADRQDLEVRLATLDERSRIAREIHDNVGHLLTRSVLQVNALQVVHRDDDQLVEELAAVGSTVNEALDAVRASVHDLHDEGFDLETQLRAAAAATEGIAVQVHYSADALPDAVGYSFLAIAREALSNTARHSNATETRISVTEHPGFYRLIIEDNGSAPSPPGAVAHSEAPASPMSTSGVRSGLPNERRGIGLATMRDRATALGGTFRASHEGGFTVFVSVPKKREESRLAREGGEAAPWAAEQEEVPA